ncbi:MAG: hypothetical protein LBL23_06065 [Coriobacteriales bacterium]|jgi:hypothetical protein|nr:hypothetical protein [Coriobacteriales bacterium]
MKKILILAGVLVAVVVFAVFYQFRPVGVLDFNAYVLQDNTVPQNLKAETADDNALQVDASHFDIFSPLYELAGDLFIGPDKAKPNPDLPVFANDGSALMMVNGAAKLVDVDFTRLDTFRGQFVSNGAAYNPDRSRSDPNEIILVALSGGLYANAMDVTISPSRGDATDIAMNSVVRFAKDTLVYYEMYGGSFFYKKITGLDADSTIRIGDFEMNYYDFLRKLGLLTDPVERAVPEEEEEKAPTVVERPTPVSEVLPAVPYNPYEVPQVSLGAMRPFVNEGFARARLHVSDRLASIDSDVTVYINGISLDHADSFTLPLSEFTGRQTFSINVDFSGLQLGNDYEIYGEYWFIDTDGVRQYVRFGDQTFRYEPWDRPVKVQAYVEPVVTVEEPLGSTVYYITSTQKVVDPANRLMSGVRYEITRLHPNNDPLAASSLYARKYASGTGDFRFGSLPPGEWYSVKVFYVYRNAYNEEVTVDLFTQEVRTRDLSELGDLKIYYENGQLYSNRIALNEVSFDTEVSPETLEAVDRVDMRLWNQNADPNPYPALASTDPDEDDNNANNSISKTRVTGATLKGMKRGEPQGLQTASGLVAATYFDYYFTAYDRFGNRLNIQREYAGSTHTCKAIPQASIRIVDNVVGRNSFAITTTDDHDALLPSGGGNLTFKIFDMAENLVGWYVHPYVAGDAKQYDRAVDFPLDGSIEITGLKPETSYRVQVIGDYDIDDKNGPQYEIVLGSVLLRTPSLNSLGDLLLDSALEPLLRDTDPPNPSSSAATIDSVVNTNRTSNNLLELLDSVSIGIYRTEDLSREIVETFTFVRDDIDPTMWDKLLSGDLTLTPAVLAFGSDVPLESKTEYSLDNKAQIRIVEDVYDINVTNSLSGFRTLRKTPVAVLPDGGLMGFTDSLYIFKTFVDDPDEAIVGGRVTVRITDMGELLVPGSDVLAEDPDYTALAPNQTSKIVALETITATTDANRDEVGPVDIILRDLNPKHLFKIEYIASEYNIGFDNSTYRTNVPLLPREDTLVNQPQLGRDEQCYYVRTVDSLSGRLNLVGMDSITGDSERLATSIEAAINDNGNDLENNHSYTLRFYKRPGYGEYQLDEKNFPANGEVPAGERREVLPDLGNTPPLQYEGLRTTDALDYYYEYRVELWVLINDNTSWIMLDQLEFDTNGPMILLGVNYAQQYYNDAGSNHYNPTLAETYTPAEDLRLLEPSPNESAFQSNLPVWAPIDLESGLKQGGCEARYLVIADLNYNQNYNSNWSGSGREFRGTLDFQGHSLDMTYITQPYSTNPMRRFMESVGPRGVIKNMVYNLNFSGVDPTTRNGMIASNSGRLTNIQANVLSWSVCYNYDAGVIADYNNTTGIIEGFAVNLLDDISVRSHFGAVSYSNAGIIRDGYVYSENGKKIRVPVVSGAEEQSFTSQYIGGIAGNNSATGRIYSVFSLIDIDVIVNSNGATNRGTNAATIGAVLGRNDNGQVSDSYSSGVTAQGSQGGKVLFDGILLGARNQGPAIGSTAVATRTQAYYYLREENTTYTTVGNSKLGLDSLRDYIWQRDLLGSAFNAEKMVSGGFYPQLVWPYCMPKQPYLPMPDYTSASSVALSSVMVEQQYEDYAIVLATFRNPMYYIIRTISFDGIGKVESLGEQTNVSETEISYKRFKVSSPSQFKSSYQSLSFTYVPINSSTAQTIYDATKWLNAEFFMKITSADEWVAQLNAGTRNLSANYRLKANIDLSQRAVSDIYVGTDSQPFTGRLDGGIYDENYELIGTHEIILPEMENMAAYNGFIVPALGGTISNLLVKKMRITSSSTVANDYSSVAFVGRTVSGAKLDNVHIADAYLKSYYLAAGLVGVARYATITNCSVNNIEIEDADISFYSGGLVGYAADATYISNCYVAGLKTTLSYSTTATGVGGLIGQLYSGEVQNVYAEGSIESLQNAYIGGIIGVMNGAQIVQHFWANVDIMSSSNGVGGVFGSTGGTAPVNLVPMSGLVVGNVSSSLEYANSNQQRPVRRFIGNAGGSSSGTEGAIPDAFAWDTQLVNGKLYDKNAPSTDTAETDGTRLLTLDDLKNRQTWMMQIGFGNGFEYNAVSDGTSTLAMSGGIANEYLPLLLSTTGTLLPYQSPVLLGLPDYRVDVLDTAYTSAGGLGSRYMTQLRVYHTAGMGPNIKGVKVEYMNIIPGMDPQVYGKTYEQHFSFAYEDDETTKIDFTFWDAAIEGYSGEELARYVDSYRITALVVDDNYREIPIQGQIVFNSPNPVPSLSIADINAWQNAMAVHGYTAENFTLSGPIDFEKLSDENPADIRTELVINRLNGTASNTAALKNLRLNFSNGGRSLIKMIRGGINNVDFENVSITTTGGSYNGVIGMLQGDASNIDVKNFKLSAGGGSYNGLIGWMKGRISNITLEGLNIRATGTYTGGFVGYGLDTIITNAKVNVPAGTWPGENETQDGNYDGLVDGTHTSNPNFVRGGSQVGAIAGYLERGYITGGVGSYITVYGSSTYTGSLVGRSTGSQNTSGVNSNNQVSHVTVYGASSYTGGIFGFAERLSGTNFNIGSGAISVSDITVIGRGERVGGISGGNGNYHYYLLVNNAKVFGPSYVGGAVGVYGYGYYAYVRNSVISSIYDDLYTTHTGLAKVSGTANYMGGITGDGRVSNSGVVDCTIGSTTTSYVGGITGIHNSNSESRVRLYSKNCTIYGNNHVGGIFGRNQYRAMAYCISDATINATGNYVGGIVGYLVSSQPLYGSNTGRVVCSIFSGKVTGANWVGGIVGYTGGNVTLGANYETGGELYPLISGAIRGNNMMNGACHMLGSVTATTGPNADLVWNLGPGYTSDRQELDKDGVWTGVMLHPILPIFNRVLGSSTLTIASTTTDATTLAQTNKTTATGVYEKAMYYNGSGDIGQQTNPSADDYRVPFYNFASSGGTMDYPKRDNATIVGNTYDPINRSPAWNALSGTLVYNSNHYRLAWDTPGTTNYTVPRLNWIFRFGQNYDNSGYYSATRDYGDYTFYYGRVGATGNSFANNYLPYPLRDTLQSPFSEGNGSGIPGATNSSNAYVPSAYPNGPATNSNLTSTAIGIAAFGGGFRIPDYVPNGMGTMSLGFSAIVEGEATVDAYAVGADQFNLEFPSVEPYTSFVILPGTLADYQDAGEAAQAAQAEGDAVSIGDAASAASGAEDEGAAGSGTASAGSDEPRELNYSNEDVLFSAEQDARTYTFTYDFATPLTVLVEQEGTLTSFEIDPVGMRRSVMVEGTTLYHVTASGVQSSANGLLPGTYLHLQNGEALAEGGVVYNLETGTIARHVGELALAEASPVPLFTGSTGGVDVQTFKSYTVVGGGTVQPMRILVRDDTLFPVDPELPVVADAVLAGQSGEESYLSFLDSEGTIVDTQAALAYPENFSASDVAEMSNNLRTSEPLVMVRYSNGKVVAFNYLSGSALELSDAAGDENFADYTSRFFSEKVVSRLAGLATGYRDLTAFKAAVEEGMLAEGHIGPNLGTPVSPDSGAEANELPIVDGEVLEPVDGATGGGTAMGNEGTASGGDDADDSAAVAGGSSPTGSGGGDVAGTGAGFASGDLAKPTTTRTVAMFNFASGLYELYDRDALLNGSESEPMATMDSENLLEVELLTNEEANSAAANDPLGSMLRSGIPALVVVLLAIGVLLVLLFVRRGKLSRK